MKKDLVMNPRKKVPAGGDRVRITGHSKWRDGTIADIVVNFRKERRALVDLNRLDITGLTSIEYKYMTVIGKAPSPNPTRRSTNMAKRRRTRRTNPKANPKARNVMGMVLIGGAVAYFVWCAYYQYQHGTWTWTPWESLTTADPGHMITPG